jgi:ubiquinone/menaquinone biosynthesis C-methylase UbiE
MYLLIGCGNTRNRVITPIGKDADFEDGELITLDINPDRKPDVVHDLNDLPLPFDDNMFDEIHAYHVLEHIGSQGDYLQFFGLFSDLWRIVKPDGFVCLSFPAPGSIWAFGDPSHTRVMSPQQFQFLSQKFMIDQCDVKKTAASDFRYVYDKDFEIRYCKEDDGVVYMMLQAIK